MSLTASDDDIGVINLFTYERTQKRTERKNVVLEHFYNYLN